MQNQKEQEEDNTVMCMTETEQKGPNRGWDILENRKRTEKEKIGRLERSMTGKVWNTERPKGKDLTRKVWNAERHKEKDMTGKVWNTERPKGKDMTGKVWNTERPNGKDMTW